METGSSENGGRAALIVNTRSRSGERAFSEAVDCLQGLGVSLGATYALHDPARLPEIVREVLDEGLDEGSGKSYDTLILGGGDGSISSVVDFLAHHRAVLGLLPLGTANDFARTLGIPSDVSAACEAIARGKVVDVDLGLIGDNYYVNLASVGLSVGVTQALTPRLKRTAGALAYPLAAVKSFLKHDPFSARLVFPDGDHEAVEVGRLLQVGVGNGRFYGGGMIVAQDSSMDDRSLDVYTIEIPRHRDLVGTVRYLKSGDFITSKGVNHYRTSRVVLETEPELAVNVDGELVAHTPQSFSLAPNALKVIVPQESSAARRDVADYAE
ncbi:MAG: lipid kinase [Rubrobacteraceae bacterium]